MPSKQPAVLLAVGTKKGLFLGRSADRTTWSWDGPHQPMHAVAAVGLDTRRETPRILVGGSSEHWGPVVVRSDDLGKTWDEDERSALQFPADADAVVAQIWQLRPGPESRPDEVWAGVEPAALFRSQDGGETFELVRGLWDHPHRPQWQPGFGGLCLHTVLPHPVDEAKVSIAISAGGVYRSADAGASWEASNSGIAVSFMPDPNPEFGQCVHKVARLAGDPNRLIAQNHGGVYASDDDGASWTLSTSGLPADFGFGLAAHPRLPETAYVVPLAADMRRLPVDGRAAVYRTDDAGKSWTSTSDGLPNHDFHSIVLRDALTTDDLDPTGLYFGTRSGEVWASADEGASWAQAASHLPDVLCVRAAELP